MPEENLKMKRGSLKSQLTRFQSYLDTINKDNVTSADIMQVRLKLDKINSIYDEFTKIQLEIEVKNKNEEPAEWQDFEYKFFKAVTEAELIIQGVNNQNSSLVNHNTIEQSVKLPVIDLPHFHGYHSQWIEFRDTFNALINNNHSISKIQKFHYLKSALKDRAANILSSLSASETNYDVAWSLLSERFENKNNTRPRYGNF